MRSQRLAHSTVILICPINSCNVFFSSAAANIDVARSPSSVAPPMSYLRAGSPVSFSVVFSVPSTPLIIRLLCFVYSVNLLNESLYALYLAKLACHFDIIVVAYLQCGVDANATDRVGIPSKDNLEEMVSYDS
ncbi:hypothetical protein CsSME_00040478 [Camellia sinensis var. sinensis]